MWTSARMANMTVRKQNIAITRMVPSIACAPEGGKVKEKKEMDASLMVISTASIL